MLSFPRVAFSYRGKVNVSKVYIWWKTFPFVVCSSEIGKSQKSKQIVKQLHGKTKQNKTKQKQQLITKSVVDKILKENLPPLGLENCQYLL